MKLRSILLSLSMFIGMAHAEVGEMESPKSATRGIPVTNRKPQTEQPVEPLVTQEQVAQDQLFSDIDLPGIVQDDFDVKHKRQAVIELIEKGISYAAANTLDKVCSEFTHDAKSFRRGELYLFVYGMTGSWKGVCLAHGQDPSMLWQNMYNYRDSYDVPVVQTIIKKAEEGGGWFTYQWRDATKVSYIKQFTKDGKNFAIGAGYYPQSKPDAVVSLVKGAVAYFNDIVHDKGLPLDEAFSTLSFPAGRFVYGDLYLYAVGFNGRMYANGNRPGLIGANVLKLTDSNGKYTYQEIINRLKETSGGIWVKDQSQNALNIIYAQKVKDQKGNEYFIACGYYPYADRKAAVELVKRGYDYAKRQGRTAIADAINSVSRDDFRYGDLYLVLYNFNGDCVAHGNNIDYIGLNQINIQDEDGRYYVKEMIEKAKAGGGWINYKTNNAFESVYVEKIGLGSESLVIGTSMYPVSKKETTRLMLNSAVSLLETGSEATVMKEFTEKDGKFIRGDLSIFVIDSNGICWVYGDNHTLTWRNVLNAKDSTGKEYVKLMINTVKEGPGQVTYTVNGYQRIVFVEAVEKEGTRFVVGSGYYL